MITFMSKVPKLTHLLNVSWRYRPMHQSTVSQWRNLHEESRSSGHTYLLLCIRLQRKKL